MPTPEVSKPQNNPSQTPDPQSTPPEKDKQKSNEPPPVDAYSKVMNEKKEGASGNNFTLESFGYLFMFITMYFVFTAVGMILHFNAEQLFPIIGDPGSMSEGLPDLFSVFIVEVIGSGYGLISPLVPYLATLIVIYPFFVVLFLWVNKRTLEEPEIRKLDMRKMLLYVTLIGTFIFMMYKFIHLVMNLLTGNGSLNFLSHFLITVSINLTIFLYCFYELREDRRIKNA